MIVEFIGPPGVGKSTVAQVAAGLLRQQGVDARVWSLTGYFRPDGSRMGTWEVHADRILGLLHRPMLTAEVVRCWRRERSGLAVSWMVNACRRSRAVRLLNHGHGVTLLEEGPLAALCFAHAARGRPWNFQRALGLLPRPDRVVWLRGSPDVVYERIVERGGILAGDAESQVRVLLERYELAARDLYSLLPGPVLSYDAATAPETTARAVIDHLDVVA